MVDCNMTANDNVFINNMASQEGGAVYLSNLTSVEIGSSTFVGNKVSYGFQSQA